MSEVHEQVPELNSSEMLDSSEECLVCLTKFKSEDSKFQPCVCSFTICRFCWYRLITSRSPACPMCRSQYEKEVTMAQLGTTLIPRLENVRQVPGFGPKAFDIINLLIYFDQTVDIPVELFTDTSEVIDILESNNLISLTSSKSRLQLDPICSSDLRRCADKGETIRLAMDYLLCVLNQDVEVEQWGHLGRQRRFDLIKAYLPHAIYLWTEILNFDENELLAGSPDYFACLCDRLDQIGYHTHLLKVTSATFIRFFFAFGPCHIHTLRLQADQATAEWRLGHTDKAFEILKRVIPMARKGLGNEHWLTMNLHNELAFILSAKGLWDQALWVSNEVLRISKLIHGPKHRDTLTVTRNKGILLTKMEKYEEATEVFHSVYLIQKDSLGESCPSTINTQFWIGQVLLKQGHFREALMIQADLFAKQQSFTEPDLIAVIRSSCMLAFILNESENFGEAVTFCLQQSHKLIESPEVTDNDLMLTLLMEVVKLERELGKGYLGLGKHFEAQRILTAVLEIQTKYNGQQSEDTKHTERLIKLCESGSTFLSRDTN